MTVCIAFVRHGQTAWNKQRRLQGRTDIELSEEGKEDVASWHLPTCLRDIPWRVSPLTRASQTATRLGVINPISDPRLIEMDWGDWEGEKISDLRARLGSEMQANEDRGLDLMPPNGESPRLVQDRIRSLFQDLIKGPPITGAISHKGVIRAVLALATGWNMMGKPQVRLDWRAAHVFSVDGEGRVSPYRLNLPLIDTGPC
jgi:broad specificity phosphatase PhoE